MNVARQRGLSLIELMIALVLGLIVVSAVFNVYVGTSKSARFSAGLQTLQETGRHGIGVLQRGFRLAGYAVDAPLDPLEIGTDANMLTLFTTDPFDCAGGSTAAFGGIARNTWRFEPADRTVTCEGRASTTRVPLIDNVDAFRVLYGLDGDGDGTPERFVSHDPAIDVSEVSALRFGMLINSGEPIRSRAVARRFDVLDRRVDAPPDRVARHVFRTTVELRNRDREGSS